MDDANQPQAADRLHEAIRELQDELRELAEICRDEDAELKRAIEATIRGQLRQIQLLKRLRSQ